MARLFEITGLTSEWAGLMTDGDPPMDHFTRWQTLAWRLKTQYWL